ncbi:MAG: DUF1365 family protein [Bdellovibrionota bacterium]|nr:DUF1365 family protein [Bdellovibrionota bacterium]
MNSKIFVGDVYHSRPKPIIYSFKLKHFMFFLDLDELDSLDLFFPFLGFKKRSIFQFKEEDHFTFSGMNIKKKLELSLGKKIAKVFFLTNLRVLGYVFNPISAFFCYSEDNQLIGVFYEVGNTFGEQKFFPGSKIKNGASYLKIEKSFYVSPFIPLDAVFTFRSSLNNKYLDMNVVSSLKDQDYLSASFKAQEKEINKGILIKIFFSFPFHTLRVFFAIHWHALILFLKKIPYIKKNDNPEKQKEVLYG